MIAASGPPARQPLLGDGNHLIESLLGPRCERFVTCSRRAKVFPLRRDEIGEEKSLSLSRNERGVGCSIRVARSMLPTIALREYFEYFMERTRGFFVQRRGWISQRSKPRVAIVRGFEESVEGTEVNFVVVISIRRK